MIPQPCQIADPPYTRGSIALLAFVIERAADFDGLRATVLLDTDAFGSSKDLEAVVSVNLSRTVLGAADRLRRKGFAPYLLDYAASASILNELYDPATTAYTIKWELDRRALEVEALSELGASTASLLSTDSATPAPMVEVRIDSRRWLPKGYGLRVALALKTRHLDGAHHLVEINEDGDGGYRISCLFELDRTPETFTMVVDPCDRPGFWINGVAVTLSDDEAVSPAQPPTVTSPTPVRTPVRSAPGRQVKTHASITPGLGIPIWDHRFAERVVQSFDRFNALLADTTFRHVSTQRDIAIYKKEVLDHPVGILKGAGAYPGGRGAMWDMLAVVQTAGARRVCECLSPIGGWNEQVKEHLRVATGDATFENDTLIEQLSPVSFLVHANNKAVWPTSARDATVVSTVITSPDRLQCVVASVDNDPALPILKPGNVRAHVDVGGWDIESIEEAIRVTHIIQFDPKGWIPSTLLNAVSTGIPLAVDAVYQYAQKHGAPPFVVTYPRTHRITKAEYDHPKGLFQLAGVLDLGQPPQDGDIGGPSQRLEVRLDLNVWSAGDVNVESSQPVTLGTSPLYGDAAVLVVVDGGKSDIELRISKGKRGTGIVVNGTRQKVEEVQEEEVPRLQSSLSIGSLPISIPTSRNQSPTGSLERSVNWESPAGRLSTSAFLTDQPTPPRTEPPFSQIGIKGGIPRVPLQASEAERGREVKHHGVTALAKLSKAHTSVDGWSLVSTLRSGLSIHKRNPTTIGASSSAMTKGCKVIEGYSAQEVFAVVKSLGCRKVWDDLLEGGRRIEYFGQGFDVTYLTLKSLFPMSSRDLITVNADQLLDAMTGLPTIATASSSVTDTLVSTQAATGIAAEAATAVRGKLILSGWILEPIDPYTSSHHPIPSTKATYYHQLDLAGSIPIALHGYMVSAAPKSVAAVETYLKTHGAPPYVAWPPTIMTQESENGVQSALQMKHVKITRQEFDHPTSQFLTEITLTPNALLRSPVKSSTRRPGATSPDLIRSETFELELDPQLSTLPAESSEEEDDHLLLTNVIIDISRYSSGYHVTSTTTNDMPDLRIVVMEIPPPPTHSATHFPSSKDGNSGANGAAGGNDAGTESGTSAGGNNPDSPSRNSVPSASSATTAGGKTKSNVKKHSIKVLVPVPQPSASTGPDAAAPAGDPSAVIRIFPTAPKSVGVAGLWSAAAVGDSACNVTVNGVKVEVVSHRTVDSKKERLKKRMRSVFANGNSGPRSPPFFCMAISD
ncbi:hypothetical protein HKX48_009103 [Thoreauomyces humboldtii]|nr:hypothetical protein HKX48_009103 [Thoreauomyces humboldtii]